MKQTAEKATPKRIFSYETLEKHSIEGVMKTVDVDYGSPASVRSNNRGVDAYRKAAAEIGVYYPEQIPRFAAYLAHEHPTLRICTAVCLVELMPSPADVREKALDVVCRYREQSEGAERMGWDWWIEHHT